MDAASRRLERERVLARVAELIAGGGLVGVVVWTESGVQLVAGDDQRVELAGATRIGDWLTVTLSRTRTDV